MHQEGISVKICATSVFLALDGTLIGIVVPKDENGW